MKSLLILGLLVVPVASFAQQAPAPTPSAAAAQPQLPPPPKDANSVIIQRRDSGLVALTGLVQGLVNRGYIIKDVDREKLTVRTEPRAVSEVGAVIVDGAVRGRQLVLTGAFAPELTSRRSTPIVYPGSTSRNKRAQEAWEELVKTAGMLGRNFTYGTR
jgi:hypothetical protein